MASHEDQNCAISVVSQESLALLVAFRYAGVLSHNQNQLGFTRNIR